MGAYQLNGAYRCVLFRYNVGRCYIKPIFHASLKKLEVVITHVSSIEAGLLLPPFVPLGIVLSNLPQSPPLLIVLILP